MSPPTRTIDLNADLGEGFPFDAELLRLVSSANVCAGSHAGSPELTRGTVAEAAALGVRVGAHVGYPDRENFGRTPLALARPALASSLREQLGTCLAAADAAGTSIAYIKPHGALYHVASEGHDAAEVLVALAAEFGLAMMHQPGTALAKRCAARDVPLIAEGFADRRYLPNGRLVPRDRPGAILTDDGAVATQAVALALGEGAVPVASICVHGDDVRSLDNARAVRSAFRMFGLAIASPIPR